MKNSQNIPIVILVSSIRMNSMIFIEMKIQSPLQQIEKWSPVYQDQSEGNYFESGIRSYSWHASNSAIIKRTGWIDV